MASKGGFDLLGVVDLRAGLAVRAQGGRRDTYLPIESVAGERIPAGDAMALKRQYLDRFGLSALYIADLDAIEYHAPQDAEVRALGTGGAAIWLDAGVASEEYAYRALESGAARVIVGLETLPSFSALASIVSAAGAERIAFSLDLRGGRPVAAAPELAQQRPEDLVVQAVDAGVTAVIVLDLARVGSRSGVDLDLLARVRSVAPAVPVYAGGGIRHADDLQQVRRVGCCGALVASALLDGQMSARDLDLYLAPLA